MDPVPPTAEMPPAWACRRQSVPVPQGTTGGCLEKRAPTLLRSHEILQDQVLQKGEGFFPIQVNISEPFFQSPTGVRFWGLEGFAVLDSRKEEDRGLRKERRA